MKEKEEEEEVEGEEEAEAEELLKGGGREMGFEGWRVNIFRGRWKLRLKSDRSVFFFVFWRIMIT